MSETDRVEIIAQVCAAAIIKVPTNTVESDDSAVKTGGSQDDSSSAR